MKPNKVLGKNSKREAEKGNYKRIGEDNGNAVLNPAKVKAIKRSKGKVTQEELAEIYNVSRSCIARIHTGRTWAHVKIDKDETE